MTPLLFAIGSAASLCEQICRARGFEPGRSEQRHFPDGETYFRYLTPVAGREVALVCSLDRPDEKATGLLFAAFLVLAAGVALVATKNMDHSKVGNTPGGVINLVQVGR